MGTTERGVYTTFQKAIQAKYGKEIELSYQLINQRGITPKIWENARKIAESDFPNAGSREHKRIKFAHAPSALILYTSDKQKARQIRSNVMKEYGRLKNGLWPMIEDGSRTRFIPLLPGFIGNKKLFQNIKDNLWTQACTKAGDVTFDIQLNDIYEPKEYLENLSMEQVIHGIPSVSKKGLPLFKHISRKWTKNYNESQIEVVVSSTLTQEATKYMRGLRNNLVRKYGNKVLSHLCDDAKLQYENKGIKKQINKTNLIETEKEYDDLMQSFSEVDKFTEILIEGMSMVELDGKKRDETPNLVNELENIHNDTPKDETKQSDTLTKEGNVTNQESTKEELMSNIKKSEYAAWEEITIVNDSPTIKAVNEKEKNKVMMTMKKLKITLNEIEKWKNKNWERYDKMIESRTFDEYNIIKVIVEEIIKDRKKQYERDKEENIMEHLMTISEENDKMDDSMEIDNTDQNSAEEIGTPECINES